MVYGGRLCLNSGHALGNVSLTCHAHMGSDWKKLSDGEPAHANLYRKFRTKSEFWGRAIPASVLVSPALSRHGS